MYKIEQQTLKQVIDELEDRYTSIRLYKENGVWIGTFSRDDAIKQYGDLKYWCGYSESCTEISIWIY